MKFYKKLYIGDTIKKPRRVKWKLKHNAGQLNIFVLTLAEGNDQLEIYHCAFLQQAYYKKNPPYVIGIANGYEEAVAIVCKITEETLLATGGANLKEYLFSKR